jgi:hypothetical protein
MVLSQHPRWSRTHHSVLCDIVVVWMACGVQGRTARGWCASGHAVLVWVCRAAHLLLHAWEQVAHGRRHLWCLLTPSLTQTLATVALVALFLGPNQGARELQHQCSYNRTVRTVNNYANRANGTRAIASATTGFDEGQKSTTSRHGPGDKYWVKTP